MRLERVQRWQWVVVSLVVGAALAYARRSDPESLLARLGEGVADQRWFEEELLRKVPLADGSTLPAFGRLTVYPMTVYERGQRKPVHVVAGMYLTEGRHRPGPPVPTTGPAPAGRLRPYFYVAPAPFQSTGDRQTGRLPAAGATVTDYLNSLKSQGVTYAYAWWADPRYAAAAWVGGSFLLIGVVWPTCVNLLAFGTLRRPREEKAESLWRVKASTPARAKQPIAATVPSPARNIPHRPVATGNPAPPQPMTVSPAPALVLEPVPAWPAADDPHKEFGAGRDDFYPTELKAPHPAETHGGKH
jgi:hypothetical protein